MTRILTVAFVFGLTLGSWGGAIPSVDLSEATIVVGPGGGPVSKAAELLQHEVASRTGIRLAQGHSLSNVDGVAVVVATVDALPSGMQPLSEGLAVPGKPEGYAFWVDTTTRSAPTVCVVGRDARGAVFAVGRLLRSLCLGSCVVTLDGGLQIATAPEYALRGHHIGYDDMNNTYDAFTPEQFEQHCRDLFVFGTNAIELCPSLDPAEKNSPHMKRTMWDMNVEMSRIVGSYGMDMWTFVPILTDIAKPEIAEEALAKRVALFKAMPHIDAVMVPGGDPGDTELPVLLPFLAQLAKELHAEHPNAGIWVSNQGFVAAKNDAFFEFLAKEQPDWLAGVVYGPWTKMSLREVRERTPQQYPIRFYPDFTHCTRSQYPVPEWDRAFAHTLGREPINPRPVAMRDLHTLYAPLTIGAIPYSEGVNDDFNKITWSLLAWDSATSVERIEQEYGRYFMGARMGDAVGEAFGALERNWDGPLSRNGAVHATFKAWRQLEDKAGDRALSANWRLQQGVFRGYHDEYVRLRLIAETKREQQALEALATASKCGAPAAITRARAALALPDRDPRIRELRARLVTLGRAIFDTIGMQLDVAHYKAKNPERGAVLEFLDTPLNNRDWLTAEFESILKAPPAEGLARIEAIVRWERPGPGSFYDDLGCVGKQPHLVRQSTVSEDPGGVASPMEEFNEVKNARLSWEDQAQTLFGTPLRMRYEGLDPKAQYALRVTYAGRFKATMRLVANGATEIHGPLKQPDPIGPVEFAVPRSVTGGGVLELEWQLVDGRGCQVAEVWLVKE